MGREVGNDVETFLLAEDALKDRVSKIEGVATELLRNIEPLGRAHITNEFCQSVLVEVNDNDRLWLETKYGLDER